MVCYRVLYLSLPCFMNHSAPHRVSVYLSLHHGRSLCAQHFDGLEDVHCPFVTHPLQDDTQSDEDTGPPHASTAAIKGNMTIVNKVSELNVLHLLPLLCNYMYF